MQKNIHHLFIVQHLSLSMHEIIIARRIIEEAKKHGKVKGVVIDVGDLAHLPAVDLEKTLASMVDWNIRIKNISAIVKCECGHLGKPKILERSHELTLFECPVCSKIPQILQGDQIVISQVEVE